MFDSNMFENSIFKIEFSILLGSVANHNLFRLTFNGLFKRVGLIRGPNVRQVFFFQVVYF